MQGKFPDYSLLERGTVALLSFVTAGWSTRMWEEVVVLKPEYIFSIFRLSSCANEKVISTSTKRITTMFLSDKIDLINNS